MIRRDQIADNVVVIAGVKRDLRRPARIGNSAKHIESLITVERGHLDRGHTFQRGESSPEFIRKDASAYRRLQVKPDDGNYFAYCACMIDQLVNARFSQSRQTQQPGMISSACRKCGLGDSLRGLAANACDGDGLGSPQLLHGHLQHWFEQAIARLANLKLRRVYAHCHTTGTGRQVVTSERALAAFIEFPLRRQRQRMRGNHQTLLQSFAPLH